MTNSIGNLLFSEMTLLWPSSENHGSTWGENHRDSCKTGSSSRGSFVDILSLPESDDQQRSLSSHGVDNVTAVYVQKKNVNNRIKPSFASSTQAQLLELPCNLDAPALWYNGIESLTDNSIDLLKNVAREEEVNKELARGPEVVQKEDYEDDLLLPCERLVKGFFIHPGIVSGFRYVVRQADNNKPLFEGKALRLTSIGRGYGKRLTFESKSRLSNDNYFYCDTHPAGYAFRLVALSEGDNFTIKNGNGVAVGFAQILEIYDQTEESHKIHRPTKQVEKWMDVSFRCRIDMFHLPCGHSVVESSVVGSAILIRDGHNSAAQLQEIIKCNIDGEQGEYTLLPGVDERDRVTIVSGADIGDIPAVYAVKGLLSHELPVIGTYIHPNILVGVKYLVRNVTTNKYLFGGRALPLQAIGKGYGKRITFEGESLTHNDNYFYSDTCEEGFGFTVEALSVEDKFRIVNSNDEEVGEAEVFRADLHQHQRVSNLIPAQEALADVRVTCHFFINGYPDCTTDLAGKALLQKSGPGLKVSVTDLKFGWQLSSLDGQDLRMIGV